MQTLKLRRRKGIVTFFDQLVRQLKKQAAGKEKKTRHENYLDYSRIHTISYFTAVKNESVCLKIVPNLFLQDP